MIPDDTLYQRFTGSPCGAQWKRVGAKRRAGVATPLFSVYSKKSIGVGELPDLELLVDWAAAAGLGILQLLPMNDMGFNFRPYDSESSFALEPMHLSLDALEGADLRLFKKELTALRKNFVIRPPQVDYGIKRAKLALLWKIFEQNPPTGAPFRAFVKQNEFWLTDYALFKALKHRHAYQSWEAWPDAHKLRDTGALRRLADEESRRLEFYRWLQWQLQLQFVRAKKYASGKGVLLMGDLPFLVSRDSAEVWAKPHYFKLDFSAGAPPDLCFAEGQRWGMPPYHWENIAKDGYQALAAKLRYAENFYDLFRIDHFVGIFRLWTLPNVGADAGGFFDPRDESLWERHGREILAAMLRNTRMLPCAEDLGTVPACSNKILEEYAVPGMDVQRWTKDKERFKTAAEYRPNAVSVISNHDLTPLWAWWEFEAETVDAVFFKNKCEHHGLSFDRLSDRLFDAGKSFHGRLRWKREISDKGALLGALERPEWQVGDLVELYESSHNEKKAFWRHIGLEGEPEEKCSAQFMEKALRAASATASIFSIQLLQDWLSLGDFESLRSWESRINFPGTADDKNWRLLMPVPLEAMKKLKLNRRIREIVSATRRIP